MAEKKQPAEKTWGNINLSAIEDIQQNRRHLITEYTNPKTGETIRQIKVNGAKWDSGNWTYQYWDGQAKEAVNIAYFNPDQGFKKVDDDDMPF